MRRLFLAVLVILTLSFAANAQTFRGAINGTVTDPSGSSVPNAQVKATETATGIDHTTFTTTEGQFSLQDLPLGAYKVTITASGFPAYSVDKVEVTAGSIYTLNVKLTLQSTTTTVEVSAAALTLDTTTQTQTMTLAPIKSTGKSTEWTTTTSGTTFRPSIRVASRGLLALSCRLTQLRNFQCRPPLDLKAAATPGAQPTLFSSPGPTTFMGHSITTIGTNTSLPPPPSLLRRLALRLQENATKTTGSLRVARSLRIRPSFSSATRRTTSYLVSPELRRNLQMPG